MRRRLAIRSSRVLLGDGKPPRPATVIVEGEKIQSIEAHGASVADAELIDGEGLVLMPGVVDTHAHINEPGRTDWEGFQTATRAAAAGGITTVVDMPLNSIPATTTLEALLLKAETARGKCAIDYGFWGGVVPGNAGELEAMVDAGALGFKAFLCDSGVPEFPMSTERDLRLAMPILARAGVPLLVHAELDSAAPVPKSSGSPRSYSGYVASRPRAWEVEAIRMMIRLARETGCRTHIVHLSASDALADLTKARAEGVPITAETCPHYLVFDAEKIEAGATHFKCAPPIREHENREALWKGLSDGGIEFVVSDHSPCTPGLKLMESGDFTRAWGGIAGLQFSLAAVWTEARKRGLGLERLVDWMCVRTARFAGIDERKGRIAPGMDADLVLWDPERSQKVAKQQVLHRHSVTPYEGLELFGVVEKTWLRGQTMGQNARGKQVFRAEEN